MLLCLNHPYFLVQYCSTVESINLISCAFGHSTPFLGPVLGFPVEGVKTVIQHVRLEPGTSAAMVSACVSRCMLKVLKHLSCAFSHDHLQIMPHLSFCPSGSGSEAGWWAGFGAGDGSGSNCRRRVSESCACESLPATRYCMRHPKSTGKQGFAGYSTFGWYGGESFTNNITMTMCQ